MNEQEFEALLRGRAQELLGEGRSKEEVQAWVDGQYEKWDAHNATTTQEDTQEVEEDPSLSVDAPQEEPYYTGISTGEAPVE